MQSTELRDILAPFNLIVNSKALSINYRALALSPTHVRGCSPFGVMEVEAATGLSREVYVDGNSFLQILRSLPIDAFEMTASDTGLSWKCGAAKGQLALLSEKVEIPAIEWPNKPFSEVSANFSKALDLGGSACGTTALLSDGIYGIMIRNTDELSAFSSDNITIASAKLGDAIEDAPDTITISPISQRLLSLVTGNKAAIAFTDKAVYCQTPTSKLVIQQTSQLKYDIKTTISNYLAQENKIELNRDVITSFIRRAEALSEEKNKAVVAISVDNGTVRLSFNEDKASSEEYYLAEGGPDIKVDPVLVDVRKIAKALSSSSAIVFDYADRNSLVLHGENDFVFVVGGKSPTK